MRSLTSLASIWTVVIARTQLLLPSQDCGGELRRGHLPSGGRSRRRRRQLRRTRAALAASSRRTR